MVVPAVFLVFGASLCAAAPLQEEKAADAAAVSRWFRSEWSQAAAPPDLSRFRLRWSLELWYVPPPEELHVLRQAVPGKPDHPQRQLLEKYERRLLGEPEVLGRSLWVAGPGNWRISKDVADGVYIDTAVTPRHAWVLSRDSLTVSPPDHSKYREFASEEPVFWDELGLLLLGGMTAGHRVPLEPGEIEFDGANWRVTAHRPDTRPDLAFAMEFAGRWDAELGRGFVESTRIVEHRYMPEAVGTLASFKGWHFDEALGRWVAERAELYKADGTLDRVLRWRDAVPQPAGRFAELVRIPRAGRDDPHRGQPEFNRIFDYRAGTARILADGSPVEEFTLPDAGRDRQGSTTWRRWAGWLTAASLAAALIIFGVRRRLAA